MYINKNTGLDRRKKRGCMKEKKIDILNILSDRKIIEGKARSQIDKKNKQ